MSSLVLLLLVAAPGPLEAAETSLRKTLGAEVESARVVLTRDDVGLTVELASEELFTKLDGLWKTLGALAREPRVPLRVEFDARTPLDCALRERLVSLHLFLKRRAPANVAVHARCTVPSSLALQGLQFEARPQRVEGSPASLTAVELNVRNPGPTARTVKLREVDLLPLRVSIQLREDTARELEVPAGAERLVTLRIPAGSARDDSRARRIVVEVDGVRGVVEGVLHTGPLEVGGP
ncbi:MAG: hypothetical protein ACOZQL_12800 [Myxococcota bacterium]